MNHKKLNLLPLPRQITRHSEGFALASDAYLLLDPAYAPDLLGPAMRLQETLAEEAGTQTQAGEVFNPGDVVRSKIPNVKVHAQADASSAVVTTIGPNDGVIYMGEEKDGFVLVESADGGGWVKKLFITH